ncbi:MAG: hypothetical protein JWP87_2589 [Labilithrix sp.]|nr:hypothetical protein [Labilithrix sp.]
MKRIERDHPREHTRAVGLGGVELLEPLVDDVDRKLVDLAKRAGVEARELGHRGTGIRLDEVRVVSGALVEPSQAEHSLVLVTKGAQVGREQRC